MESIEKHVKAAFWAILQAEVNKDPPVFDQVLRLLDEVKEVRDELVASAGFLNLEMSCDFIR